MESLETAVSMFGKSLITLGDTSIQNKNDSELRDLQNMLPVNYGNSGSDKKLYTIVIDGSRSMEFNNKLQIVKRAACNLIDLLEDRDSVCRGSLPRQRRNSSASGAGRFKPRSY